VEVLHNSIIFILGLLKFIDSPGVKASCVAQN